MRFIFVLITCILFLNIAHSEYNDDEFAEFDTHVQKNDDPYYKINSKIFNFNMYVDKKILLPITLKYLEYTSEDFRKIVNNFIGNIGSPANFAYGVAEADVQGASVSLWRFWINSTLGLFGLFDIASEIGLPGVQKSFGGVLNRYGVGSGSYVVLPFLGPSTTREMINLPVSGFMFMNFGDKPGIGYRFAPKGTLVYETMTSNSSYYYFPLIPLSMRASLLSFTQDLDNNPEDARYNLYKSAYLQFSKFKSEQDKKKINNLYEIATSTDSFKDSINYCNYHEIYDSYECENYTILE